MGRREFGLMLSVAASAMLFCSGARAAGEVLKVGTLTPGAPIDAASPFGKMLIGGLAQHGYREGDNLSLIARGAGGQIDQTPKLAQELVASGAQVLVIVGYPAAVAAKKVGLPAVVTFGGGDPVATGLVQSLAHPGGTITGISDNATELSTKRLSVLQRFAPGLRRVAMLWNRDDLGMSLRYEASRRAAEALGITVDALGVREPNDFNNTFSAMTRTPPDAILMVSDALTTLNRQRVFDFAAEHKLPALYEYDFLVRDGGLMSYGPDLKESFERAAALVVRIAKGAKPADLPFEQPTRYPLVFNLKTADAIGLTVLPDFLALADEVIE